MADHNLPPDFALVGAAKSGTTAFYDVLHHHPQVYCSPVKEPHYFSQFDTKEFSNGFQKNNDIEPERYFSQKSLPEHFQLFISDQNQYLRLFESAPEGTIKGEASTSYLYIEDAPHRMRQHNPGMKILAILRNPIDRAYSHYLMALKFGYTDLDFLTAIRKDQNEVIKGWGKSELFLELGQYDDQIERYYHHFPREQIHLIHFEDWKINPQEVFHQAFRFLEIDLIDWVPNNFRNSGEIPRYKKLNRWLHRKGLRQSLADRISPAFKEKLRRWYLKPKDQLPQDDAAREFLREYYKPRIERLAELWGRDLSGWLK